MSGRRAVLVAVAAASLAVILGALTLQDAPRAAPPQLGAQVVEQLRNDGWSIEPDAEATASQPVTAQVLAKRYAAPEGNPEVHVVAVSLARVVRWTGDDGLVWVVYSEDVLEHCFGHEPCTGHVRELAFVSPDTLEELVRTTF